MFELALRHIEACNKTKAKINAGLLDLLDS